MHVMLYAPEMFRVHYIVASTSTSTDHNTHSLLTRRPMYYVVKLHCVVAFDWVVLVANLLRFQTVWTSCDGLADDGWVATGCVESTVDVACCLALVDSIRCLHKML